MSLKNSRRLLHIYMERDQAAYRLAGSGSATHWTAAPLQNTNNYSGGVLLGSTYLARGAAPDSLLRPFSSGFSCPRKGQCSPRKPHLPIGSIWKAWLLEYIFTPSPLFFFCKRQKPQMFFFRFLLVPLYLASLVFDRFVRYLG